MILAYAGYVLAIALLDGSSVAGASVPVGGDTVGGDPVSGYLAGGHTWRQHGCQTCHSIYGLGGHAGPDLTNVFRRIPDSQVRHVILDGHLGMPAFDLTEGELQGLIDYLVFIGETGAYPPQSIRDPVFGFAP